MNKALKIALPILGTAAAAAAATAFLIAPGRASEGAKEPFMGKNIAHRGLHKADKTVPENSLAAFADAAESGYGVEFDVHITKDGHLVVFHDDDTRRMCGVNACVEELNLAELQKLYLAGSDQRIPSLGEVLAEINGRVPIILEIKRGGRNDELCRRVYEMLMCYDGEVCVESFDPFIVRWWYKNAPEVLRGQLSSVPAELGKGTSRLNAFRVGNCLTNVLCRPNFSAYGLEGKKPLTVKLVEKMGAMKVCYTSHGYAAEEENDCVIFEYYRPRTRFK